MIIDATTGRMLSARARPPNLRGAPAAPLEPRTCQLRCVATMADSERGSGAPEAKVNRDFYL